MSEFNIKLNFDDDALTIPLEGIEKKIRVAIMDNLNELGEEIYASTQNLVPIDTGALKNSSFITRDIEDGYVIVGYGLHPLGYIAVGEYALKVHENINIPHTQGMAKFLEYPAMAAIRDAESRIGDIQI